MIIASRKKCRYKIGTLDINKTNDENLFVLNKCRSFYSEFGFVDDKGFDFSSFTGVTPFLDEVRFIMLGTPISLSSAGKLDVHVDYYDRSITFYGFEDNFRKNLKIGKATITGASIMDIFKMVCNWYLPLREISTHINTRDEFDEINPLSGRIISIENVARSTTNDTNVNRIGVVRNFDEESKMYNIGIAIDTNECLAGVKTGGWGIMAGDNVANYTIDFEDDKISYKRPDLSEVFHVQIK